MNVLLCGYLFDVYSLRPPRYLTESLLCMVLLEALKNAQFHVTTLPLNCKIISSAAKCS
jgi:hypothetical protein